MSSNTSDSTSEEKKKTCLYELHLKHGGKLVDFAGFLMPVLYKDLSIVDSHLQTRRKASLFDVSHMLQTKVHGKDAVELMESITVADVKGLQQQQGTLTLFTNASGGIIDDLIVTKTPQGYLYVVSNAGCIQKDQKVLNTALATFKANGKDVALEYLHHERRGLIALQGPLAAVSLQPFLDYDLSKQAFMTSRLANLCGVPDCRITRCGYTGEDGFEISMPGEKAAHVVETLLGETRGDVKLAGLGARDTLRLEAGLCLYGNELDERITPVEGGLVWTIGKRRRDLADFPGAEIILKQIKAKPAKRRVGLKAIESGPTARGMSTVVDSESGREIGIVTSGCPSPSLKHNICMAYVETPFSKVGGKVTCSVRGKKVAHEIVKMPFVPTNYFT